HDGAVAADDLPELRGKWGSVRVRAAERGDGRRAGHLGPRSAVDSRATRWNYAGAAKPEPQGTRGLGQHVSGFSFLASLGMTRTICFCRAPRVMLLPTPTTS